MRQPRAGSDGGSGGGGEPLPAIPAHPTLRNDCAMSPADTDTDTDPDTDPVLDPDPALDADTPVRADLAAVRERHALGLDEARPEAVAKRLEKGRRTARENL